MLKHYGNIMIKLYCRKIIIIFDPNSIYTIIMIVTFQITIVNKMYFLYTINYTNWKNTSSSLIFYSSKTVKRTTQY